MNVMSMFSAAVYACKIQSSDYVLWFGKYFPITGLEVIHDEELGVLVVITCQGGVCVVPHDSIIRIMRPY